MKEVIAQEVVRRIASEVFAPKEMEKSSGLDFQLYPPRTDEEIIECAKRLAQLSVKALSDCSEGSALRGRDEIIEGLASDIQSGGPFSRALEHAYDLCRKGPTMAVSEPDWGPWTGPFVACPELRVESAALAEKGEPLRQPDCSEQKVTQSSRQIVSCERCGQEQVAT